MKKILAIGNALVDILMRLPSDEHLAALSLPKGSMQLIDDEQMRTIAERSLLFDQHAVTGGSAANTISALARLGVPAGFIGKVGDDEIGRFFASDMRGAGIATHLIPSPQASGRCNVFISPDSERTMATYLGAAASLSARDLSVEMFRGYGIFHIEGYLVQNYALISRAVELAKEAGLVVSLDLASYNVVAENREFLTELVERYVDIVFANEEEAEQYAQCDARYASEVISSHCGVAVVKVGSDGSYVQSGSDIHHVPARKVTPIDTTGAGDVYAAGFLYGYAAGMPLDRCAELGTLCASEVIAVIGAKLPNDAFARIAGML